MRLVGAAMRPPIVPAALAAPAVAAALAPVASPATPAPAPVRPASPPPSPSLWDRVTGFFHAAVGVVRHVIDPNRTWHNPDAPRLPDRGGLKVASYNIMLGGARGFDNVLATLKPMDADVICLQEASKEAAAFLAERLGMHYTYMGSRFHPRGKAILSTYPITASADRPIPGDAFTSRVAAYWAHQKGHGFKAIEPLQKRTVLHATIKVGERTVDVLDNHLALAYTAGNTKQLDYLTRLSKDLQAKGHTVIAAGDFNTNLALAKPGKADAPGVIETVTDTEAEFADRYRWIPGNIADPANRAAAQRLLGELGSFWDAERRTVVSRGRAITPEQALAELRAGVVKPGTPRHKALLNAMDGNSIVTAFKRFDNVLVSKDARVVAATIDQTSRSSDHQPVAAELRWAAGPSAT